MVQSPSWEANWFELVKKLPVFHGTRRFITALTSVRQLSLSWASPVQSLYPHPTSWRFILILSTHLRLGLSSGLLPSGFHTKILYIPSPHPYHMPVHFILLDFISRTILYSPHFIILAPPLPRPNYCCTPCQFQIFFTMEGCKLETGGPYNKYFYALGNETASGQQVDLFCFFLCFCSDLPLFFQ